MNNNTGCIHKQDINTQVSIKKRLILLTCIMVIVSSTITIFTATFLYRNSLNEYKEFLQIIAQSQARLIESVAEFNSGYEKIPRDKAIFIDVLNNTLYQITKAHEKFKGFDNTGEFTLAKLDENKINFLLKHRLGGFEKPTSIDLNSNYAEPMRLALSGKSGIISGLDYRGETVIAAYEPIKPLGLGFVVKIDLSEVKSPFINAAWVIGINTMLITICGIALSYYISRPLIKKLVNDTAELNREILNRHNIEKDLKYQNERMEAIIKGMNVGTWEWNVETGESILNERCAEMMGYTLTEISPTSFNTWVKKCHPDDLTKVNSLLQDCFEQKEKYFRCEARFKHKNNNWVWVLNCGNVNSWLDNGKPEWMFGTLYDISGKKQLEEAMQKKEEMLRLTFAQSPFGITVNDLEGNYISTNTAYQKITGYTNDELVKTNFLKLTHPNDRAISQDHLDGIAAQNSDSYCHNTRYIKKDNSEILVRVYGKAILDTSGSPIYIVGFVQDITQQKQNEVEKERLSKAIEQVADIVIITNINGEIEYTNPAFEKITGYTTKEVLGKNPRILKSGMHEESFYKDIWTKISNGELWKGSIINKRKNGELYTEEVTISPVFGSNNSKIINYIAIKRDITNKLELEKQLHHSEKMVAIGQLAGGVAHDFNNQLTGILGFAYLLKGISQDTQVNSYASKIINSGERAAELTNKLLTFSRKGQESTQPVDMRHIIADVISMLERIVDKRITINESFNAPLSTVLGDPEQLHNAILNIGINARDAMPNGGKLNINTSQTEISHDHISGQNFNLSSGLYISISISDTGIGMSQELQDKIFDPFFTTKDEGKGTGLGLSSVYATINHHNGNIRVSSIKDEGTTFNILLPITTTENKSEEKAEELTHAKDNASILIVDDEETVRDITSTMLNFLGYKCESCINGEEAINIYKKSPESFDLILLDMIMPKLNGRDTYYELCKINPDVSVIIVTGYSLEEQTHDLINNGVKALIRKPFTEEELSEVVAKVLSENE